MAYSWFRLYSEMLSDRKLSRAARLAACERATAVGVWVGMMCLASESSERGKLLLAPGVPFTAADIAEEVGCAEATVAGLLDAFHKLEMVAWIDGVLSITHWQERQYESDKSTERVRKHRATRKRASNVSGTLPERSGNAPDTDSDTETDHSQNQTQIPTAHDDDDDDDDNAPPPTPPGGSDGLRRRWQRAFGAGGGAVDREALAARVAVHGEAAVMEALERMLEMPADRWCLRYLDTTLDNLQPARAAPAIAAPVEDPPVEAIDVEPPEEVDGAPAWWGEVVDRVTAQWGEDATEQLLAGVPPPRLIDDELHVAVRPQVRQVFGDKVAQGLQDAATAAAGQRIYVRLGVRANGRASPRAKRRKQA